MKEMIRRFDEVLSDKASKIGLHELETHIEKLYVKKKYWDILQENISKTTEHQQKVVKGM